jgi:hypothetical protein
MSEGSSTGSLLVVRENPTEVLSLSFGKQDRLLSAHGDGAVRLWDLSLDSLIRRATATAGRELTHSERLEHRLIEINQE